jgi:hypothetical protein
VVSARKKCYRRYRDNVLSRDIPSSNQEVGNEHTRGGKCDERGSQGYLWSSAHVSGARQHRKPASKSHGRAAASFARESRLAHVLDDKLVKPRRNLVPSADALITAYDVYGCLIYGGPGARFEGLCAWSGSHAAVRVCSSAWEDRREH